MASLRPMPMRPSTSQMNADDRQVLAGLGVGQLDAVGVDTLVRQMPSGSPQRSAASAG